MAVAIQHLIEKKVVGAWDEWTGVPRYGRAATEEEIRHVIENLTEFRIRGEYIVGRQGDNCSLDNVRLLKALSVVNVESRGKLAKLWAGIKSERN